MKTRAWLHSFARVRILPKKDPYLLTLFINTLWEPPHSAGCYFGTFVPKRFFMRVLAWRLTYTSNV